VLQFSASLPFDRRLAHCDIRGSIAHVEMLAQTAIISAEEAAAISGLEQIREEVDGGTFPYDRV
jgi:argininosuccinate lyase